MEYRIHTITSKTDLNTCPLFQVDRYNWGGSYRPKTYGRMGFLEQEGFYIEMICEEANPIATYTKPNDPVHLDSTMEAFFQFFPEERPDCYLNFEANSNAALHANFGDSRKMRKPFPKELHEACLCQAVIEEDRWILKLLVPLSLIAFVYGKSTFQKGDQITCNFYKIKESEGLTHFGSFTEIHTPAPDFHQPQYFATGILV